MKRKTTGEWSNQDRLENFFNNRESELEPLHIRLERIQLEIVQDLSNNYGLSKAEVIRKLVREGMKQVLSDKNV
ncbi:hypothetical protein HRED_00808 [Candidatus Haloredivivus sp. G17]|nr:hypothetical protein HRED_00808 [Candidatus Haloredivivus sp. G17]